MLIDFDVELGGATFWTANGFLLAVAALLVPMVLDDDASAWAERCLIGAALLWALAVISCAASAHIAPPILGPLARLQELGKSRLGRRAVMGWLDPRIKPRDGLAG
ncbi:hypothetical protein [Mangrovicoccus ximenensis]|uniref:hypothetical protein n=1 Tax=Mangrovicoccus ximenensis TaxID=1911570 RepID=UPI000D3B226A|nr:hypothetical protein [Mangrovicoccus ximenensis]